MKKFSVTCLAVGIVLIFGFGNAFANPEGVCPDGKLIGHLKIIGVPQCKTVNMEDKRSGNVIFVMLGEENDASETQISLTQGDDFAVLDKNGTDGEAAFVMPPTGLDTYIIGDKLSSENSISNYSVFIRALGTPGGKATMYTCADIAAAFATYISNRLGKTLSSPGIGTEICSLEQITNDILVRYSNKPKFINVTAELLTIVFEVTTTDGATYMVRAPIFSPELENEYWEYDNEGLKNLDIRFYDCSSDVTDWD